LGQFIICDVAYDGEWIRFQSLDPSTGRSGCNWMRAVEDDKIEFRFTFTEREFWCRKTRPYFCIFTRSASQLLTPLGPTKSQLETNGF
jgi:hypothetical protein